MPTNDFAPTSLTGEFERYVRESREEDSALLVALSAMYRNCLSAVKTCCGVRAEVMKFKALSVPE